MGPSLDQSSFPIRYVGAGPISQTLLLVGKGVVYDTGGADVDGLDEVLKEVTAAKPVY